MLFAKFLSENNRNLIYSTDSKDKIRRCEVTVKGENFNSSSLHLNKKWIKKNSMTFQKQKKIYILSGSKKKLFI